MRKLFTFSLHKGKLNEETIWNFQALRIQKRIAAVETIWGNTVASNNNHNFLLAEKNTDSELLRNKNEDMLKKNRKLKETEYYLHGPNTIVHVIQDMVFTNGQKVINGSNVINGVSQDSNLKFKIRIEKIIRIRVKLLWNNFCEHEKFLERLVIKSNSKFGISFLRIFTIFYLWDGFEEEKKNQHKIGY